LGSRLTTLLCKKNYCCEIQTSENWVANLAESSEEGYGSNSVVLPMIMMMTMTMMRVIKNLITEK
jgi:hypothetical protein